MSVLQRVRSLAPVVAAALCIACAVLLAILWFRLEDRQADEDARDEALAAARSSAVALLSYDYRQIDEDVEAAQTLVTAPFRSEYEQTAETLRTEAERLQAIVQADVKTAAVESATADRVAVLLFVDQSSVKKLPRQDQPETRSDEQRVRMTMVKQDGRWLVSELFAIL